MNICIGFQPNGSDKSFLRRYWRQDFTPRINLSEEDFAIITRDGELLDDEGLLNMEAFEMVMKDQVKRFVQRQLTNILAIGRCSDAEEVQISTMKAILYEQVVKKHKQFETLSWFEISEDAGHASTYHECMREAPGLRLDWQFGRQRRRVKSRK
jgi:hypothetical protein